MREIRLLPQTLTRSSSFQRSLPSLKNSSTIYLEVHLQVKTTVFIVILALASCVECLAGTTGVMHGYVRSEIGQPVANAVVTATSPSDTCTTFTDKQGFFVCLSLVPDVYTVSAQKPGTSNAYAMGVRISSDQASFLVFQFSAWHHCPAYTRAPLAAEPFVSLDVRRMETYPRNVAPAMPLPMVSFRRPAGCL